MDALLLALAVSLHAMPAKLPAQMVPTKCALIERNHAELTGLKQWCFWELSPDGNYHCIAFLLSRDMLVWSLERDPQGQWNLIFQTRGRRRWYRVRAPAYRHSKTDYDPEVLDREVFEAWRRRGLRDSKERLSRRPQ